ncbi:hypothetical protein L3556_05595 [Candidatus Synechococcus calcipolaris G9]|uniref:Replication restart DNA helicase PriA n=1 Tax=Candidatus Synechococcus calcipolaris G9 TaxID=1497997 RepID=A0ABT6EYV3_9SYNE|nr:replication restart DNA helicase PriA [Candidatus Synechococcus calcipolaris]MDG2990408.1 hypothetical protein [Candidatus Synechococcus calcipolaris G9]
MTTLQTIHCPNCGSYAERHQINDISRTQCPRCDYLMVMCNRTGRVIEAHAPGLDSSIRLTEPVTRHRRSPLQPASALA